MSFSVISMELGLILLKIFKWQVLLLASILNYTKQLMLLILTHLIPAVCLKGTYDLVLLLRVSLFSFKIEYLAQELANTIT